MKTNPLKPILLGGLALTLAFQTAKAEGTKEITPNTSNITALAILPDRNSGPYTTAPDDQKLKVSINSLTETIYYGFYWQHYGSSASVQTNMFIEITDPDGIVVRDERLTTSSGYITSLSQAQAGPIIGGLPAGGYTPDSYVPLKIGDYTIAFKRSTNTSGSYDPAATTVRSQSPFFDITVVDASNTPINGRLFSRLWGFVATDSTYGVSSSKIAQPSFYAYSNDETIVKLSFGADGFKPIAFNIAFTKYGVSATELDWAIGRQSYTSVNSPSLPNGYRVFVNHPDATIFPVTPIPGNPSFAQQPVTGCAGSYFVNYILPEAGDARLIFDINGVPGFQDGTSDFAIEVFDKPAGPGSVAWDGLDGLGNPVPTGTAINIVATYRRGRFNFPIHDAEVNKNGLWLQSIAPLARDTNRLYWDDTQVTLDAGTCSGSTAENNYTTVGVDNSIIGNLSHSGQYTRAWNGNHNPDNLIPAPEISGNESNTLQCDDYGNVRVLNTWFWALESESTPIVFYFGCFDISGSLFNDVNGLSDDLVNNSGDVVLPSETIYVYLTNQAGDIIAKTTIDGSGNYSFTDIPGGAYDVVTTTSNANVGDPVPAVVMPSGWELAGEQTGNTSGVGIDPTTDGNQEIILNQDLTNVNFGIQQPPTATDNSIPATENPGGTISQAIPTGSFITADQNGGEVDSIIIPTFPTNATSITIGTTTYYPTAGDIPGVCPTATCAVFPGTGVTLPVDASGNPVETVSVDPLDGTVTVGIPYVAIDNGNTTSDPSNPATLSIPFNEPTLVSLLQFNATAQQGAALLTWITASEENNRGFNVLHSLDGKEWSNIAFVPTKAIDGNSKTQLSYNYLDQKANLGLNYYRLMQTDVDGKYSYSIIRQVSIAQGAQVNIHPNPTTSLVNIGGLNGSELVVVYDLQGKKMLETKATSQQITLDFSNFVSGVYTIQIVQNNKIVSEKVMKK